MAENTDVSERMHKKLYIKYMVCMRDKSLVQSELDKMEIKYRLSIHGAIVFLEQFSLHQQVKLKKRLLKSGLVLLDQEESLVIDRIITTITEIIHNSEKLPKLSFSDIINENSEVGKDSVLQIFSDVKGMSVIQFIVIQKIERAKELLLYEDRSLSEITDILNYKNQDLLVAQLKKYTGLGPDYFKSLKEVRSKISSQSSKPNGSVNRSKKSGLEA